MAAEEELMRAIEANDPAWLGLLAQWLAVIGVVRSKHLRRSYPVKLTDSVYAVRVVRSTHVFTCAGSLGG